MAEYSTSGAILLATLRQRSDEIACELFEISASIANARIRTASSQIL